ncbi:MAG: hypothetical protein E7378_03170 [Clostridiales bacterium]|nr:hypothetical protein [Clostridiales bacterium]
MLYDSLSYSKISTRACSVATISGQSPAFSLSSANSALTCASSSFMFSCSNNILSFNSCNSVTSVFKFVFSTRSSLITIADIPKTQKSTKNAVFNILVISTYLLTNCNAD